MNPNQLLLKLTSLLTLTVACSGEKHLPVPMHIPVTFVESLPDEVQKHILWYSDNEDQSLSKWTGKGFNDPDAGGGIFVTDSSNTSFGIESGIAYSGFHSSYATIRHALTPGQNKAVRFMRWTDKPWYESGKYFPKGAYYSTFLLIKEKYNPRKPPDNDPLGDGGWWNIFQFKSKNNAGSHPVAELDLYNSDDQMYLGLIIKDYPDNDSSDYNQSYIMQTKPLALNDGRWNHIEAYYEKSSEYKGRIIIWQNGQKIFDIQKIRTVLPSDETAVWGIGNYTDYITGGFIPGAATLYFDDSIVSSQRVGTLIDHKQFIFK